MAADKNIREEFQLNSGAHANKPSLTGKGLTKIAYYATNTGLVSQLRKKHLLPRLKCSTSSHLRSRQKKLAKSAKSTFLKDLQNFFRKHLLQHLEAEVLGSISIRGLDFFDLGLGHGLAEDLQHRGRRDRRSCR